MVGIEPTTYRLQGDCSTTELHRHSSQSYGRSYPGAVAPMIAEELVVLAFHPDGMVHGGGIELDCALAGALLLELAIDGAIDARDGRLHAAPDADARPTRSWNVRSRRSWPNRARPRTRGCSR